MSQSGVGIGDTLVPSEILKIWVPLGTGYRENLRNWVPLGTEYRAYFESWVPLGTGYRAIIKNLKSRFWAFRAVNFLDYDRGVINTIFLLNICVEILILVI